MAKEQVTLAEAAAEILKASISKAPKEGPKKLPGEIDDTGEAIVTPTAGGKDYAKKVKKDKSEPTDHQSAPEGPKKLPKGSIPEEKITVNVDKDGDDDDDSEDDNKGKKDKITVDGDNAKDGEPDEDDENDSGDDDESDDDEDDNKNPFKKEERRSLANVLENEIEFDVSEDIKAMFKGTTLSEDFKAKATTIFEAAVVRKIKEVQQKLAEEYDNILGEEIESIEADLSEQLDDFVKVVASDWLEENKVPLENSLRTELTEDFIEGLKNLFAEHYIDIPDSKIDVVSEMTEENNQLKSQLDEEFAEKIETYKYITELEKTIVLGEAIRENNLTLAQEEKIKELAEEVKYENPDKFAAKIGTLIESYFKDDVKTENKQALSEEADFGTEEVTHDANINALSLALSRYSRNK